MIKITLNGKLVDFDEAITVAELINIKKLQRLNIIVEVNREIIDIENYGKVLINNGDIVELINFIGGG